MLPRSTARLVCLCCRAQLMCCSLGYIVGCCRQTRWSSTLQRRSRDDLLLPRAPSLTASCVLPLQLDVLECYPSALQHLWSSVTPRVIRVYCATSFCCRLTRWSSTPWQRLIGCHRAHLLLFTELNLLLLQVDALEFYPAVLQHMFLPGASRSSCAAHWATVLCSSAFVAG